MCDAFAAKAAPTGNGGIIGGHALSWLQIIPHVNAQRKNFYAKIPSSKAAFTNVDEC